MKRADSDLMSPLTRKKPIRFLIVLGFLYILLVVFELPLVLKNGPTNSNFLHHENRLAPPRRRIPERKIGELPIPPPLISGLNISAAVWRGNDTSASAERAVALGRAMWLDVDRARLANRSDVSYCPSSISTTGQGLTVLPCGLAPGSHVTVIGKPWPARNVTLRDEKGNERRTMSSTFTMELLGLEMSEESESKAPKILHLNPRLRGDWSGRPVIELNDCYRMTWGTPHRCIGRDSRETVDGLRKCEMWHRDVGDMLGEMNLPKWITDMIGKREKATKVITRDRPFPFEEEKMFVLTVSAGSEGYHVNVDGRHVASFKYRDGFAVEDATGLHVGGDIDVVSIFAGSLPALRPAYAHKHLDLSEQFRAPPIPDEPVDLFIGILSAGSHFAERMAIRKTWMRHNLIRSSRVVARFVVALHTRKEVNLEVKKEAEFFGDIIVVPYIDHYDLVVLKTVAIVEFGVRTVSAKYIMKGDDDTFIRVDAIVNVAKRIEKINKSFYTGNMNYHHQPLRIGKWAVTNEEWHEGLYPTYANGPGYIISSDIANFILSEFEEKRLRLFKMEDVSMGIWVKEFGNKTFVEYVHSLKYCQYGCVEGYVTAHYQSPRLMLCLWEKLRRLGKAVCCNIG